eukprot:1105010_1
MMAEICIYDRVTLLNGLQGEVQFMGHMENNKRDCFYGIKLNTNQGQNNGTYNGIKYFSCSYNHGIFVTKDQIVDSKPTTFNERLPRVCIGDAVNVTYKKQNGILRFVGSVSNHDGCSYGVEFLGPFGDTNGCKDGRKYFDCLNYHGLFCCFDNIQLVPKTEPQNTANTMNIHNGLDPALHDLDPTKDDIYKPIATTFDPSTYDTAQSVIYNAECDQETNTNTSIQPNYITNPWQNQTNSAVSHKKGLFGKKQQRLADVLSFTEFNKMKVPLHKTTNKEIETQCMQTWKNINSYIGIRKSSKSSMGHVHKLLLYALKGEDVVRNEIYCQLIKQTTRNPKLTSAIKGWKLLLICCSFFPPSQEFIAYLSCYLWSHTQQTNGIGPFAVKALHALDRIVLEGPRAHLPLPSEIEKIENLELN